MQNVSYFTNLSCIISTVEDFVRFYLNLFIVIAHYHSKQTKRRFAKNIEFAKTVLPAFIQITFKNLNTITIQEIGVGRKNGYLCNS